MKKSTRRIILAALEGDETLSTDELRLLRYTLMNPGKPPPPADPPLLVAQSEACRLLGISRYTAFRLTRDGVLHPVKLRGMIRYPRKELERVAEVGYSTFQQRSQDDQG